MLGDRSGEPGARGLEQLRPGLRIELAALGDESGGELHVVAGLVAGAVDEVVVRPCRRVAVGGAVMPVLGRAADVHVARIPLVPERRDAEAAPVVVDAELAILEPGRGRGVL